MRLVRGTLAVACLLAGCWLVLRALGMLGLIRNEAHGWWPALLVALGAAILARSVKPGPHIALSVGLMLAGCASFATTRGLMTGRYWTFTAAAGLVAVGALLAWANTASRSRQADSATPAILILFRAAEFTPAAPDLKRIAVFLVCGRLDLHLDDAVQSGSDRDTVMIDIISLAGTVKVTVAPDVQTYQNDAFVKRFRQPAMFTVFDDGQTDAADVAVSTLALFGGAEVKTAGILQNPGPQPSGALPGPDGHPPATP